MVVQDVQKKGAINKRLRGGQSQIPVPKKQGQ